MPPATTGALVVGAALVGAVALRGGFSSTGKAVFALAAGLALAVAVVRDEDAAARALRLPPILVLAVLGAVLLASAAWTVGPPRAALAAGLATLGLAALATASAVLCAGRAGAERLALVLAMLAAACAVLGLAGVVLRVEPWGERIDGAWRPGGPFEYPPALALLQVGALPVLLARVVGAHAGHALLAAGGASLAATVLALSQSRLQLALAAVVLVAAIACSRSVLGVGRARPLAAATVLVGIAVVAAWTLGGYATPGVTRGSGERLAIALVVVSSGAAACWMATRAVPASAGGGGKAPRRAPPRAALAVSAPVLAVGAIAAGAFLLGAEDPAHGRLALWADAGRAALERPWLGAGAGGFPAATAPFQDGQTIGFAHNLPLHLTVELGFIGLALGLALYGSVADAVVRVRDRRVTWLLAPAVMAFLAAGLLDWQWHLAGSAAVFAACLGPLLIRPLPLWRS